MPPPPPPPRRRRIQREHAALPIDSSRRWCHLVVFCSSVALFRSRSSSSVSGDVINNLGGVSEIAHITVTDIYDRILGDEGIEQISIEIGPENAKDTPWEGDDDDDDSVAATAAVDDAENKKGEQLEIGPENVKGTPWEGDDDDDDSVAVTAVVDDAENKKGEHDVSVGGEDTIASSVGQSSDDDKSGIKSASVADSDEPTNTILKVNHTGRTKGKSFEEVSMENEEKATTELPIDDDTTKKSKSAANNDVIIDTEITLGEMASPTSGNVSVEGRHDDDDDDDALESVSESVQTIISENEVEAGDSRKGDTTSKKGPLNDDNGDNDDNVNTAVEISVSDEALDIIGGSTQHDDTGVPSAIDFDSKENSLALSKLHSQPTTYHRNQYTEGGKTTEETVGNNTEAENGNGDVVPDKLSDSNVGNGGSDLSAPTENITQGGIPNETTLPSQDQSEQPSIVQPSIVGNGGNDLSVPPKNIAPGGNPNETILPGQDKPEQPSIQDWGDEDDESLFETIRSTFNVILLAIGLTSLLVFRKRVNDRVRVNPSLGVSSAIKDEVIDVVIRMVSWATNKSIGGRENGNDTEIGDDTLSGFGRVSETIALSTAADEEWGWEDEEIGTKLELSAMRGDEAKEDDGLALAIAMSISDTSHRSDDVTGTTASVHEPIYPSNMNGSKYSPSTTKDKSLRPSSKLKFTRTSFETQSYSTGDDSIADLLDRMAGTGGPVITSIGPNPMTKTKQRPRPKNESADDIFAEMGLSTSYRSTAASRPSKSAPKSVAWQDSSRTQSKANAHKSAQLSSLLADTLDGDVDADTWGDDGDLDDLLD